MWESAEPGSAQKLVRRTSNWGLERGARAEVLIALGQADVGKRGTRKRAETD